VVRNVNGVSPRRFSQYARLTGFSSRLELLCAFTLRFIQLVATNVITRLGARCDMEGAAPIGAYFPARNPRSHRLMGQICVLNVLKMLRTITSYEILKAKSVKFKESGESERFNLMASHAMERKTVATFRSYFPFLECYFVSRRSQ